MKSDLKNLILKIEKLIDGEQVSKALFKEIETLINKLINAHENYAVNFSKNETVKGDSIKRKEELKSIDVELEN